MADSNQHEQTAPAPAPARQAGLCGVRVVGMHRSGTSYLAGAFAAAGYIVGPDSMVMGPAPDNTHGFFERLDVCAANDRLLTMLGSSWESPPLPEQVRANRPRLAAEISALREAILEDAAGNPIVLKDPRLSLLLPVWDAVSGDELLDVLVTRNPIDIAASLRVRNQFPQHFSLALWQLYTVSALIGLRGKRIVTANFDRLSTGLAERSAWLQVAGREFRRVGLPPPELGGFASETKHFRSRLSELLQTATPEQLRLWNFVENLEPMQEEFDVPSDLLEWPTASATLVLEVGALLAAQTVFAESASARAAEAVALARLDAENKRLEAEVSGAHSTVAAADSARAKGEVEREELAAENRRLADEVGAVNAALADAAAALSEANSERDAARSSERQAREDAARAHSWVEQAHSWVEQATTAFAEERRLAQAVHDAETTAVVVERVALESRAVEAERRCAALESVHRELSAELAAVRSRELALDRDGQQRALELEQLLQESEVRAARVAALEHEVNRLSPIEASRDSLLVERDSLLVERDSLLVERDSLLVDLRMRIEQVGHLEREGLWTAETLRQMRAQVASVHEAMREQLQAMQQEHQAQQDLQQGQHQQELAAILGSRSWRLTRPLRALFTGFRGGRPRSA